ncbi:MAG: ComF family protein [Verrucomicrobia bacterium]|nr:ComF family protein [Verrucomicrobiota bacterium]
MDLAWTTPALEHARAALSFIYPEACQLCGTQRAKRADGYVCSSCWQQVRFIKPPFCGKCGLPFEGELTTEFECANCREMELHFDWARSSVAAKGVVLEAIHRYKYDRQMWFEEFLGDLLIREARPVLESGRWDLIVPVPLHPVKQREREFNQAERLGRRLGAALNISVNARLVQRVEPTRSQTRLTRQERAENVRRAFALSDGLSLKGRRCLLVDDVFTTGATTSACARLLRRAGAESVAVWTVARGL